MLSEMAMKRLALLGFAGVLATLLAGCPIYDENGDHGGCIGPSCGPPNPPSGCSGPTDCGVNETCGDDNQCHTGDCTIWGCSTGFECVLNEDMTASCAPEGSGTGGTGGTGGSGGGDVVWCGNPDDCAVGDTCAPDGTCRSGRCDQDAGGSPLGCIYGFACIDDGSSVACRPENPAACGQDLDCSGVGADYLCVSGICTAPEDQCFDQTQCATGNKCVNGKCTAACAADPDCPGIYTCSPTHNICTIPAVACVITNDCGGPATVCVDGACVPRSDGPTCPSGTVWVENGCIPNQSANFVCGVDGQQDICASGSICLHHSCYISCEPPNEMACAGLPSFNQCKPVTTISGPHQVCGSDDNLGDQCNPTLHCAQGGVCIDGYCK
jgi:hypothetical protein